MKQRSSSRTIKLSKAFRTIDDETRRALAEQRLMTLEHDNYNEQELIGENHADDNYVSDVSISLNFPYFFKKSYCYFYTGLRSAPEKEAKKGNRTS